MKKLIIIIISILLLIGYYYRLDIRWRIMDLIQYDQVQVDGKDKAMNEKLLDKGDF